MNGPGDEGRQEIIIVRRGGHDEEEGHHGGVWKIAFADFMTAMMCFFLVMWLINAANEETRAAVASYFNPVKLVDRSTSRKGLEDIGEGPETSSSASDADSDRRATGRGDSEAGPTSEDAISDIAEVSQRSDESLFSDPYAVLAEIAEGTGTMQNVSAKGEGGAQDAGPATGASGGEAYRDPFAPDFWTSQVERAAVVGDTAQETFDEGPVARNGSPDLLDEVDRPLADPFAMRAAVDAVREDAPGDAPEEQQTAETTDQASPELEALAQQIRRELGGALGRDQELEGVTVVARREGVMISVADDIEEGMFEIGSAVPRRELVLAMERIGRTLAAHAGNITINGHTDARPFAPGGANDNWRLSTARAHATYYMLVRGGIEEQRVKSVAGFADRRLKVPENPLASANRRIEILLEKAG